MPIRSNLCLMQEARVVPIKGSVQSGTRPHINFAYVKYTSSVLAGNAGLIGRKVRIYYDVRDIRAVKAFFEDGTELGVLTAARPWHTTPHSLRLRQEIHRLIAERKLTLGYDECPVVAWTRFKWRQVKGNKRAANALAKAQSNMPSLIQPPVVATTDLATAPPDHPGDIPPIDNAPAPAGGASQTADAPKPAVSPKPKALQIRRTITF
ncbi:MAG: hypothetical protein EOO38_28575 [Cytophagaceae bacterium]|nr:MAG: hypothetical protein EOO38_28575 [Cytophagaceae bacterium]